MELGGAFSYQGTVSIDCKISKASKDITLNSKELLIHTTEVHDASGPSESIKCTSISYDTPKQRATLSFDHELSGDVRVVMNFQGM